MKTFGNALKKTGSKIFGVDLKSLRIKLCDRMNLHNLRQFTTTHEDFTSRDLDSVIQHQVLSDELPVEYDGVMYFGTEDEAFEFVKFQIGL